MNLEIATSLSGYIETLYNMNQKIIKLCGVDVINKREYAPKEVLDIIQDIPRLIPYKFNRNKQILEYTDRNGLLEYKNDIDYLENSYEEILKDNYDFLNNIRLIRNQYEHKMHGIKRKKMGSGTESFFNFTFEVSNQIINIQARDFICLVKMLNNLFSQIVKDILTFAFKEELYDNLYFERLRRFDFEDFNKIYDSKLLRTVGKVMLDY